MANVDTLLQALGLIPSPIDPSLNEALSPSAGLDVTPFYFQSTEQEGRWKSQDWGYEPNDRTLIGPQIKKDPNISKYINPADTLPKSLKDWSEFLKKPTGANLSSQKLAQFTARKYPLLQITIGPAKGSEALSQKLRSIVTTPLQNLLPQDKGLDAKLIDDLLETYKNSIFSPSSVTIDANWLSDGVEILAGYAGVAKAVGFLSIFGHRAKVNISGTTMGNYLPASFLIGLSGYVNPVGPIYIEFRCGVVIAANSDPIRLYGSWWSRDGKVAGAQPMTPFSNDGWVILIPDPGSYPK